MDRRQQIIEAALRVFAKEGFHQATIKKIASEAGIKSPALIYWYFKDKDDLFQAVARQVSPLLRQLPNLAEQVDSPPEEMLLRIARIYLSTFDDPDIKHLFRIMLSEAARIPEVTAEHMQFLVVVLNLIIAYLEHQVDLGRLRPHHTQSAARAFMGALMAYIMNRELFLPLRAGLPDPEQYVQEVVDIFLNGVRAERRL